MNVLERLAFMRRGFAVERYHQRHTIKTDTVASHSAGVAGFIVLMAYPGLPSAQLLCAALAHDLPECETGDTPSPFKRGLSKDARKHIDQLEDKLLEDHGFAYELSPMERVSLKIADCFDGLAFCCEERWRGNKEIIGVAETYIKYLKEVSPASMTPNEIELRNILFDQWEHNNV